MKDDEILDRFTSTIANALLGVSEEPGWHLWPMPIFHPTEGNFYLYAPERSFVVELLYILTELEATGLNDLEIAQLFKKPSRIATLTYTFEGFRHSKLTKQQGIELAIRLLNYIKELRVDPFCKDMRNILWTPEMVNKVLAQSQRIDLQSDMHAEEIRKTVGKINAGLWLLCEYLYFAHHSIGHEFHGPYQLENRKTLVIREYYDLKCESWEFANDFPSNEITLIEIYKDSQIQFDFFNRMRSVMPISSALTEICVKRGALNGRSLNSVREMETLLDAIISTCNDAQTEVADLSKVDLLKKYVDVHYYVRKQLCEKLDMNWRPPLEVYQFIERVPPPRELMDAFKKMSQLSRDKQLIICRSIFDPRVEKLPF